MWEYYYYSLQGLGCPQMPKCKRSIYKLSKEPNANNWYGSSMQDRPSNLKIQLESPNVQTIKDQVAYDLQSLIGEVGGTHTHSALDKLRPLSSFFWNYKNCRQITI